MRKHLLKKPHIYSIMLILTAIFALALGGRKVYAGGDTNIEGIINGLNSDGTASVGKTLTVKMTDLDDCYGGVFTQAYANGEANAGWSLSKADYGDSNPVDKAGTYKGGVFSYTIQPEDEGKWIRFETYSNEDTSYNNQTLPYKIIEARPSADSYLIKTKIKKYNGPFTLVGHSTSYAFDSANIYTAAGKYVKSLSGVSGQKDFSIDFTKADLAKLDPDVYIIKATLNDANVTTLTMSQYIASSDQLIETSFTSPITEKITIKRNTDFFSVGSNYICFRPYFTVDKTIGYVWIRLYDTKTKKWGDAYGPFDSYEIAKTDYFKGTKKTGGTRIQPNRTYKVVAFYGKKLKNAGTEWWENGPDSNTITVKTGKKSAPAIKSITAKATKTKKIKLIQHAHWDVYGKWVPYKESYTWTTTYKVTVRLKKKPGTTGIYIGDKKCKGNKLKYTATFTDSGKLKGKKITFGICSYNDAKLGAYSKTVKKKVTIK